MAEHSDDDLSSLEEMLEVIQNEEKDKPDKAFTILLVDDEENNLKVLSRLLEDEYNILQAHDGLEALELLKKTKEPVHLIISDQRMPKLTGVEFLEKTLPMTPRTMRMILTGFTDVDVIIDAINKGHIYKFILKPFDAQEMLITVKRALEMGLLEEKNIRLVKELKQINQELEQKVEDRTQELAQQNVALRASNRKLMELDQTKEHILVKLNQVFETNLKSLQEHHQTFLNAEGADKEPIRQAAREAHQIENTLKPITSMYFREKAIQNKRVLLAENNRKQQVISKMALGGTGVELDIASSLEEGGQLLAERSYDIICTNSDLIELATIAHDRNPNIQSVFMTSESAPAYLQKLQRYPVLSNIVSRNEEDRVFTLKNILTTVSKLITHDLFGLEKYLNWGVEISEFPITSSETRHELVEKMEDHFKGIGVRRTIISKCASVAEELLMNAIYDAPTDADGNHIYNDLSRMETVELSPKEQGVLRYACDGLLLGISVEDPFGSFHRQTILDYLQRCYEGIDVVHKEHGSGKAGAGLGLFQIMEMSDLLVWNVKPGIRTEVISIFNLDPQSPRFDTATSFHYFYG